MKKINLSNQQIANILNKNFDDHFWIFQLGINSQSGGTFKDNDFSFDFYGEGKKMWEKFEPIVKEIICDNEKNLPKEWVNELISGDIRNLIISIVSILVSTYSIELSIAIPIMALILKKEITKICEG